MIDCNKTTVLEVKESSMIKEYEEGFQEALKKSLVKILPSNPTVQRELTPDIEIKTPQDIVVKEVETPSNISTTSSTKVESYTNGSANFQKINIGNGQFILVTSTSSAPFATFSNSTKADVYRIVLQNGSTTLGYLENGNLVVEMPNADGSFRKEVFGRK